MAYRKRVYKRKFPRRKAGYVKRRRTAANVIAYKPRSFNTAPFPARYMSKLAYSSNDVLGPGIGLAIHQYRSALFDPDVSAGGHQPMYRDQLYLIYKYARVAGFAYTLDMYLIDSGKVAEVNVLHKNETTLVANIETATERPLSKTVMLSDQRKVRLRGFVSTPKVWGLTAKQFRFNEDFWEDINGNKPRGGSVEAGHLHINAYSHDGTNISIRYHLKLIFFTEFFDRIPVAQS